MPGDNDNDPFVLDLHPKAAEHVYHLTARHEEREYFPLSSILTPLRQPPWSTFVEEELPGAHADVGGGYAALPEKILFPRKQIYWLSRAQREEELQKLKLHYEAIYHRPGINITMHVSMDTRNGPPGSPYRRSLVSPYWIRHVRPQLAHSALQKMHARAVSKGVPLQPLAALLQQPAFSGRALEDVYELPAELKRLLAMGADDELYKRYIHHSHQYRTDDTVIPVNAHKPEENPEVCAPNGRRAIFYNQVVRARAPSDQWKRLVTSHGNGPERSEWVRK